jgi:hypothetical protein
MKTKHLLLFLLLCCRAALHAQNKKQMLSVEFGYGINQFDMGSINQFYIDSFAAKPSVDLLEERITSGQHFRLGINYRPMGLFDFGFYGSYQYGNSESNITRSITDETGAPISNASGTFELRTEAIGAGLSTTWYISHLLKFQEEENKLHRLHLGFELNGGIGFSRAVTDLRFETALIGYEYNSFSSRDFQGQGGIKVEYDFTESPVITSLGIRLGYQYFSTQTLQDRVGRDWIVGAAHPISLNFSGGYFGVYVKIGR